MFVKVFGKGLSSIIGPIAFFREKIMNKTFLSLAKVAVIGSLLSLSSAFAQSLYIEGKDYTTLENPLPLQEAGKEEVLEFFSYTCPHCANLEPHLVKWAKEKKPEAVNFYQIPGVGGKLWTFTARTKFVADKLNLGHEFDSKMFTAIHTDKNRRLLGDKDSVIDFMVKEGGADKAAAEKAWDSLQVKSALKKSAKLWQQAGLSGVPVVIVNGKYVVRLSSDYDKFFNVIDYLLVTTGVPSVEVSDQAKAVKQKVEAVKQNIEKVEEKVAGDAKAAKEKVKEIIQQ